MLTISRVDRIGDALKSGEFSSEHLVVLDEYRRTFQPAYQKVVSIAKGTLNLPVTGRPSKSTSSIIEKLRRESMRLSQMQDVAGCRIIVDDCVLQERFANALNVFLGNPRIVDRRDKPSHGYRAIHLMPEIDGHCVEVQVRTVPQHIWAEISEKLADTIDAGLKYGQGDEITLRQLSNLSEAIQDLEDEELARAKFFRALKDVSPFERKQANKRVRELDRSYWRRRDHLLSRLSDLREVI